MSRLECLSHSDQPGDQGQSQTLGVAGKEEKRWVESGGGQEKPGRPGDNWQLGQQAQVELQGPGQCRSY